MRVIFALLIASISTSVWATVDPPSVNTGNELLYTCSNENEPASFWICAGFLQGVRDTVDLFAVAEKRKHICIPATATNGQIRDVAVAYLQANPAKRHYRAASLVMSAWMQAFPCPSPAK